MEVSGSLKERENSGLAERQTGLGWFKEAGCSGTRGITPGVQTILRPGSKSLWRIKDAED